MHKLGKNAEQALIADITNHPFTTAYISARTLGNHNCKEAVSLLREFSASEDYMLAGESIIALAKMKDTEFRPDVEKIILDTQNPRLRIMGAEALGIYHNYDSVPVLLDILRGKNPPPYVRDEVIMAISEIIDTQKKFYKILSRYSADNSLAVTLALDEAESTIEFVKKSLGRKKLPKTKTSVISAAAGKFQNAVSCYVKDNSGEELSLWISELADDISKNTISVKPVFLDAVLDDDLIVYDCLRLLIVHWAAQELRIWAAMQK